MGNYILHLLCDAYLNILGPAYLSLQMHAVSAALILTIA